MRTGTFWLLMPFMTMVLGGCLQKAKTSISALGPISLQSPQLDSSSLPDFDNAHIKGYVRFRGSCVSVINGFQIQFVHSAGADSGWFDIPAGAPAELRETDAQTNYPLTAAEYDANCEGDGRYDFWVTMNQITDWIGSPFENLFEISQINLRGVSPFITSSVLYLPTRDDDATKPEANTFMFYAGIHPVTIGVGYCQPFEVGLAHEAGGDLTYKVKNSVVRTLGLVLENDLMFGSSFLLYQTPDCSGAAMSNADTAVVFPAGIAHLRYSYKVTTLVSPEKKMTLATSFGGNVVSREFRVKTGSSSSVAHKVIVAPDSIEFMTGGECRSVDLIIVDPYGVATKDYPFNIQIAVSNPDIAKFQLRSNCNENGVALSSVVTLEFQKGVDYKKTFHIRSLAGVNSSTVGEILLSETTSVVVNSDIPDLYINPSLNVNHLKLTRGESLNFLFNHECYPFEVSLVDSSGNSVSSSHQIKFKITTMDEIQIFDDPNCQNGNLADSELVFFPSETQRTYYWSRRQPSMGAGAYTWSTSSSGIGVDVLTPFLVAQPGFVDSNLSVLSLHKSPLDWLGRGRGQILHWHHLPTAFRPDYEMKNGDSLTSPEINKPSSFLFVNGDSIRQTHSFAFTEGTGSVRNLFRNFFDLTYYGSPLLWMYNSDTNVNIGSISGSAALIGAYLYFPNLSVSSKQRLFGNLSSVSNEFRVMVNSNGSLHIEHGIEASPTTHCQTSPAVIQEERWQSVFVRFANESGVNKCAIFVNGFEESNDSLPAVLSTWNPQVGSASLPSDRLHAYVLEIIIDKDLSSLGVIRYNNTAIQDLHDQYFENRYKLVP